MPIRKFNPCVEIVEGGVISPLRELNLSKGGTPGYFDGSVFRADGSVCDTALIQKGGYINVPGSLPIVSSIPYISGSHIFGGMLQNTHFGHFVSESLARLWAIKQLSKEFSSILYFARIPGRPIPRWANELFSLIVGESCVRIVEVPTRIDLLAVPSQISSSIGTIHGHPLVKILMAPLRALGGKPGSRRLYVSRSGLKGSEGGFLMEEEVELRLKREGYEVIYPETMSIKEQFEAYNTASHLIFSEGSAIHLYALAAHRDQRVFIIWRRKAGPTFSNQICSFGGQPSFGVPAIRKLFEPVMDFGARARARAMLDFEALGAQLVAAGFIESVEGWQDPEEFAIAAALEDAERALRKPFREVSFK